MKTKQKFVNLTESQKLHKLVSKEQGYAAIMSVMVIGSVGTVIAAALLVLGLGASRTSFAIEQSTQAKALANACAEMALQQLRDDSAYTAISPGVTVSLGQGSCTYIVVNNPSGENKKITASGTVGTIVRKVQITTTAINPQIIYSWQEQADFN